MVLRLASNMMHPNFFHFSMSSRQRAAVNFCNSDKHFASKPKQARSEIPCGLNAEPCHHINMMLLLQKHHFLRCDLRTDLVWKDEDCECSRGGK